MIGPEHGVEDDEHFAHTRGDGHIVMFTGLDETLIKGADNGVVLDP